MSGLTSLLATLDAWCARGERRPGRWLALLAALLALQVGPRWYATPDGAAYLSMARAIAAGGPIMRLGDAQLGFPIGYPLLISPVFLAGARPLLSLSIAHWLLAIACMLGVYRWARDALDAAAAPWIAALVMVNVHVWILYRRTLSEAAFCAVLPWTVSAWNAVVARLDAATPPGRGALVARTTLAALLLMLLVAIREAGALVGVGVLLAMFRQARHTRLDWRAAGVALAGGAVAALCVAALVRPERLAAAGPAFVGALAGYADGALAAESFGARLHLRVTELGELVIPGMFKAYGDGWADVTTLVYVPLAALLAFAWWRVARRSRDVFVWTAPPYLALYLAWPYAAGARYLLPLLPVLWLVTWELWASVRYRRLLFAIAIAAHLGVAAGYLVLVDAPRARACHGAWPAIDHFAARLGRPDAAVAAAPGVSDCVRLMLSLAIDRPVPASSAFDTAWVLAPKDAALPPGRAVDTEAGEYVLAGRTEQRPSSPP